MRYLVFKASDCNGCRNVNFKKEEIMASNKKNEVKVKETPKKKRNSVAGAFYKK